MDQALSLAEAQARHRAGDLRVAEALYRRELSEAANGDAAAGLGALLRSEGRNKEAGELYHWALKECSLTPILISNTCNWLRETERQDESIKLLTNGLQQWPSNLHLRWGLVLSLHQSGETRQALKHLELLIMEQGKRPALLRELVACLLNCERWSEALKAIENEN